jgi:hypothetical protein
MGKPSGLARSSGAAEEIKPAVAAVADALFTKSRLDMLGIAPFPLFLSAAGVQKKAPPW